MTKVNQFKVMEHSRRTQNISNGENVYTKTHDKHYAIVWAWVPQDSIYRMKDICEDPELCKTFKGSIEKVNFRLRKADKLKLAEYFGNKQLLQAYNKSMNQ